MNSGVDGGFPRGLQGGRRGQGAAMLDGDPSLASGRAPSGETPLIAALYRGPPGDRRSPGRRGRAARHLHGRGARPCRRRRGPPAEDPTGVRQQSVRRLDAAPPRGVLRPCRGGDAAARRAARTLNARLRPTAMRNTPLHAAVAGGRVEAALTLIEAGADGERPGRRRPHAAAHRRRGRIRADRGIAAAAQRRPARGGCRRSDAAGPRRRAAITRR